MNIDLVDGGSTAGFEYYNTIDMLVIYRHIISMSLHESGL
jgi:hypothetical protein